MRFIELMPTGSNLELSANQFFSCRGGARSAAPAWIAWSPWRAPGATGRPRIIASPGAPGTVGVITPMSHTYCDRCNRMRLTADGHLRPCLFGDLQTNLRDPLRAGTDIVPLVEETLRVKPQRHYLIQGSDRGSGGLVALSQTGG